jgi:hypothetical protein
MLVLNAQSFLYNKRSSMASQTHPDPRIEKFFLFTAPAHAMPVHHLPFLLSRAAGGGHATVSLASLPVIAR